MEWVSTSGAMRIPVISGSEGSENARGSVPCLTAADGVSGFSRHQIQRLPDRPTQRRNVIYASPQVVMSEQSPERYCAKLQLARLVRDWDISRGVMSIRRAVEAIPGGILCRS